MKNSKVLKGILILLGLMLTFMGFWRLLNPISFFEYSGLILTNESGFGLIILFGAFKRKLTFTSTVIAVVLFFGFGIARLISVVIDGNPGAALWNGIIGEFVFGSLALFALIKYREK